MPLKIKWGGFCCQAPPRAPPQLARAEDLRLEFTSCITQRGELPEQSCRWQLLQWASVGAQAGKVFAFTRPSILCRPQTAGQRSREKSGGAAGHCPRVRSAYYARVYRHSLPFLLGTGDRANIGAKTLTANNPLPIVHSCPSHAAAPHRRADGQSHPPVAASHVRGGSARDQCCVMQKALRRLPSGSRKQAAK